MNPTQAATEVARPGSASERKPEPRQGDGRVAAQAAPARPAQTPTSSSPPPAAPQPTAQAGAVSDASAAHRDAGASANHAVRAVSAAPARSGATPTAATAARNLTPAPQSGAETPQAQFARGLSAALRQGGGSITLHLKPEDLGDLRIRMHIQHGSVEARFEASTVQAQGLLNESMETLRAALEARGLDVERLSVHVAERNERHEAQDAPPRDAGNSGDRHGGRGHGQPRRHAARTPHEQEDAAAELLAIPQAWAESLAGTGGALRLDAIA